MKLAFISGAYRADTVHGIVENIRKAEAASIECWRRGYAVICPHKNSALLDGVLPDKVWLDGDLEMLRRCDVVVMLPGWKQSAGSVKEYATADAWRIHIKTLKEIMNEPVIY
jgi:hypothetical protein